MEPTFTRQPFALPEQRNDRRESSNPQASCSDSTAKVIQLRRALETLNVLRETAQQTQSHLSKTNKRGQRAGQLNKQRVNHYLRDASDLPRYFRDLSARFVPIVEQNACNQGAGERISSSLMEPEAPTL